MTEKDFWALINDAFAAKGRIRQVSGYIDTDNQNVRDSGQYLGGHSVLFNGHNKLPVKKIEEIAGLLFDQTVSQNAKEAVLVLLAHYPKRCALDILIKYAKNPDKNLKYFADIALWECKIWNE